MTLRIAQEKGGRPFEVMNLRADPAFDPRHPGQDSRRACKAHHGGVEGLAACAVLGWNRQR